MDEFIRLQLKRPFPVLQNDFSSVIKYVFDKHHCIIPDLYSKSFNDKPWNDDWDQIDVFDPDGVFLVEDDRENVIFGFIISFVKNDFGYISILSILPEYRNCGFGSLLVQKAIEYLAERNIDKIYIDVEKQNSIAKKLYTEIGFRPIG